MVTQVTQPPWWVPPPSSPLSLHTTTRSDWSIYATGQQIPLSSVGFLWIWKIAFVCVISFYEYHLTRSKIFNNATKTVFWTVDFLFWDTCSVPAATLNLHQLFIHAATSTSSATPDITTITIVALVMNFYKDPKHKPRSFVDNWHL